jgi:8-amino-7-oxononanoate synthase
MWQENSLPIDKTQLFRPNLPLAFPGLNIKVPRPEEYTDFTSNDYLGITSNPNVRELFLKRLHREQHILGSRSVRLLDGNSTAHTSLERRLNTFYNSKEALLFNSGYDANLSVFSTLPAKGDILVFDEFVHASAIDGMRLSATHSNMYPFQHNSPQSLRNVLNEIIGAFPDVQTGKVKVFIAIETLYSMNGDFAPILELIAVCEELLPIRDSRHIIVDEAHTVGAIGSRGRGLISELGLEDKVDVRVQTFSKALGNMGGMVFLLDRLSCSLIFFDLQL